MTDTEIEQTIVIKFLVTSGAKSAGFLNKLVGVYGENSFCPKHVCSTI